MKYTPEQRIEKFWSRVDKSGGEDACWIWTAGLNDGYGRMHWNNKRLLAHRIAYELSHGQPPPDDLLVIHSCDNRRCCNPKHLSLGTIADNNRDRDTKGRGGNHKGEKHGRHKITAEQVREIRRRYAFGGISQTDLAKEFGISQTNVAGIVTYQRWKHLP